MYVDVSSVKQNNKVYTRYLLRSSYREDGKVKHRTIANLSHCSENEIKAIQLALRHKEDLTALKPVDQAVQLTQGSSLGAAWVVYAMARQLGIERALGPSQEGKLALWQVMARVIDQGSRLSAVRLAGAHAAGEFLRLDSFNEEDLYRNLDWLSTHQAGIEDRLFRSRPASSSSNLFLYDVTSSYLEGEQNELSAFGYNRDGKKGKRQITIGLLCDGEGRPLSIEVFPGNTNDTKTVASQIKKIAERFGGGEVTFVGDRGMIKNPQIEALAHQQMHYITAITKPQIEALLKGGILQMDLFDDTLAEVVTDKDCEPDYGCEPCKGIRYVIRRNPQRAAEIGANREAKYQALSKAVERCNSYLLEHPRARVEGALRTLEARAHTLRISPWVKRTAEGRTVCLTRDEAALMEETKLDGCYVLKTDLSSVVASKEVVHDRYKDLALVERAFRESKTVHLQMRPVYVRKATHTRGHAFVVMLAYVIIRELRARWMSFDLTVQEGLDQLATLCLTKVTIHGQASYNQVPTPRESVQKLLDAVDVRLPGVLPEKRGIVTTKKKLQKRRKTN